MGKFPQSRCLPKGQIHHNQLQSMTLRKGRRVPRRRVEETGTKLQAYISPFACSSWSYLTDISAVLNRILLRCCREYSQIHDRLNKVVWCLWYWISVVFWWFFTFVCTYMSAPVNACTCTWMYFCVRVCACIVSYVPVCTCVCTHVWRSEVDAGCHL